VALQALTNSINYTSNVECAISRAADCRAVAQLFATIPQHWLQAVRTLERNRVTRRDWSGRTKYTTAAISRLCRKRDCRTVLPRHWLQARRLYIL